MDSQCSGTLAPVPTCLISILNVLPHLCSHHTAVCTCWPSKCRRSLTPGLSTCRPLCLQPSPIWSLASFRSFLKCPLLSEPSPLSWSRSDSISFSVLSIGFILLHYPYQFHFFFFWLHHTAYGVLVHQPGTEPVLLAVEVRSLNHWTAKEVLWFQI